MYSVCTGVTIRHSRRRICCDILCNRRGFAIETRFFLFWTYLCSDVPVSLRETTLNFNSILTAEHSCTIAIHFTSEYLQFTR